MKIYQLNNIAFFGLLAGCASIITQTAEFGGRENKEATGPAITGLSSEQFGKKAEFTDQKRQLYEKYKKSLPYIMQKYGAPTLPTIAAYDNLDQQELGQLLFNGLKKNKAILANLAYDLATKENPVILEQIKNLIKEIYPLATAVQVKENSIVIGDLLQDYLKNQSLSYEKFMALSPAIQDFFVQMLLRLKHIGSGAAELILEDILFQQQYVPGHLQPAVEDLE